MELPVINEKLCTPVIKSSWGSLFDPAINVLLATFSVVGVISKFKFLSDSEVYWTPLHIIVWTMVSTFCLCLCQRLKTIWEAVLAIHYHFLWFGFFHTPSIVTEWVLHIVIRRKPIGYCWCMCPLSGTNFNSKPDLLLNWKTITNYVGLWYPICFFYLSQILATRKSVLSSLLSKKKGCAFSKFSKRFSGLFVLLP